MGPRRAVEVLGLHGLGFRVYEHQARLSFQGGCAGRTPCLRGAQPRNLLLPPLRDDHRATQPTWETVRYMVRPIFAPPR